MIANRNNAQSRTGRVHIIERSSGIHGRPGFIAPERLPQLHYRLEVPRLIGWYPAGALGITPIRIHKSTGGMASC
jgi:hypothetical protein